MFDLWPTVTWQVKSLVSLWFILITGSVLSYRLTLHNNQPISLTKEQSVSCQIMSASSFCSPGNKSFISLLSWRSSFGGGCVRLKLRTLIIAVWRDDGMLGQQSFGGVTSVLTHCALCRHVEHNVRYPFPLQWNETSSVWQQEAEPHRESLCPDVSIMTTGIFLSWCRVIKS